MRIDVDPRLDDYMRRKGYAGVVVESITPTGCCADICELSPRLAKADEVARLKTEGWGSQPAGSFELVIASRGLEFDEVVSLELGSFLGLKHVKVKGIVPWRL